MPHSVSTCNTKKKKKKKRGGSFRKSIVEIKQQKKDLN